MKAQRREEHAIAALHAERANFYAYLGDLFSQPATEEQIASTRSALEVDVPPDSLADVRDALLAALVLSSMCDAEQEHHDLFRREPKARKKLFEYVTHMLELARLADACAHAMAIGAFNDARQNAVSQRVLLREHVAVCLRDFAMCLEKSKSAPFHQQLGIALRRLIEHDFAMVGDLSNLGEQSACADRFVALGVRGPFVRCPEHDETVTLEACSQCGRWDGSTHQVGGGFHPFILCRNKT